MEHGESDATALRRELIEEVGLAVHVGALVGAVLRPAPGGATFDGCDQLSVVITHVLVNGTLVIKDGIHSGAKPGKLMRGPGWSGAR